MRSGTGFRQQEVNLSPVSGRNRCSLVIPFLNPTSELGHLADPSARSLTLWVQLENPRFPHTFCGFNWKTLDFHILSVGSIGKPSISTYFLWVQLENPRFPHTFCGFNGKPLISTYFLLVPWETLDFHIVSVGSMKNLISVKQ